MKVQELRKLLGEAERELIEKAFLESYKHLPKNKKEELDETITDILKGREPQKAEKAEPINFESLESEIAMFVENAYAQNYFAPNRVIPKSQRPKWRFLVKNYIKELERIPVEGDSYPRAVKCLEDLYGVLCYGCNYYIFSTEDPFRSVGWRQPELFHMLVKKTFSMGYSKENMSRLLLRACTGGLSRESLHEGNMIALLSELKTTDVKYMAIDTARELIKERKAKFASLKKYENDRYSMMEAVNNLSGMILMISAGLGELEDGVKYFFENNMERTKEIALYRALDYVDDIGDDSQWIWVYEYGIKAKIKPREQLVEEYEERRKPFMAP